MSGAPGQLPLALGHTPSLASDNFLVAACNADAVAWLDRWPDWPAPALAIHGPDGCGKTHLAHMFCAQSGGVLIAGSALTTGDPPHLLAHARAVVVEDADRGVDEPALFHLYNAAKEAGAHLLLTGRDAPARWPLELPDLRSRLSSVPAVAIRPPGDDLMASVLVKLFGDRQLRVSQDAIGFLLARIERSFAEAHRVVAAIDAAALAQRRAVTVPLLRAVLDAAGMPERER